MNDTSYLRENKKNSRHMRGKRWMWKHHTIWNNVTAQKWKAMENHWKHLLHECLSLHCLICASLLIHLHASIQWPTYPPSHWEFLLLVLHCDISKRKSQRRCICHFGFLRSWMFCKASYLLIRNSYYYHKHYLQWSPPPSRRKPLILKCLKYNLFKNSSKIQFSQY